MLPDAFVARLDVGDCWLWTGFTNKRGYGRCSVTKDGKRSRPLAHRFVWETLIGPVPEGYELDHLCLVKACVNPDHLEVVSHLTNMRRAVPYNPWAQPREFCSRGHSNWGPSGTKRRCRTCSAARQREYAKQVRNG